MAQHLCNVVVLVTSVMGCLYVHCTGTDEEHNDTNVVGQSNDDVAKITEMTLINVLHIL